MKALVALPLIFFCPPTLHVLRADGIDSGGGRALVGTLLNHASVGAPVATTLTTHGETTLKLGLIHDVSIATHHSPHQ